ncbi:MAG: DUF1592 domain-containing protein [Vicinamibacterales bacterium]|nr:DUF1592 domain-containing protein [Vicinamibacterales bacterium]
MDQRRAPGRALGLTLACAGTLMLTATSEAAQAPPSPKALIDQYCVTCHNSRQKVGGLALDAVDTQAVGAGADVWEKVVRKLRAGAMPPVGNPRPDRATYDSLTGWLETALDRAAVAAPNPGRTVPFHRLNRTEYQNAIRDILGVDGIDMGLLLPADDVSYGFDNIGGVLKLSSTLIERYLSAARKISRIAVGDPELPPDGVTYRTRDDLSQWDRLDPLPPGTRGGILVRHNFSVSGEYTLKVQFEGARDVLRPADDQMDDLELAIDGERVKVLRLTNEKPVGYNGDYRAEFTDVRVSVKAGPRDISVTFVKITSAQVEGNIQPYAKPQPHNQLMPFVHSVTVTGPFGVARQEDTPSRARIFTCRPGAAGNSRISGPGETACARTIVTTLARRAYRRPVTGPEVTRLMTFYAEGAREGGFEQGVARAIERLLVSPSFLFRVERDPAGAAPDSAYRLTSVELASRLSFFLWSSVPDDELISVAAAGRLRTRAVLDRQVTRLLASPRADAFVRNFAGQWLQLRNLDGAQPNAVTFSDFNDNLRQSMRRETEMLFEHVLRNNRSVLDLLDADYTFVDERLAKHYGIPGVYGARFRRVPVASAARRGLLGHGSILTVTSYATRTSPVVRGKWILDNLLGAPPPPPPPNVPTLSEKSAAGAALSMREAMTRHRANPACASCHAQMDPLGFALENFDAVGHWRDRSEAGTPIDASGGLPDGAKFEGVNGLRQVLLSQPERFVTTVTEKLMTYALGRGVESYDMPAIRRIVRDAAPGGYTLSALVSGVIHSVPFQMRRAQP